MSSTDAVKHVGGWVSETGRPFVENAKRRENAQTENVLLQHKLGLLGGVEFAGRLVTSNARFG